MTAPEPLATLALLRPEAILAAGMPAVLLADMLVGKERKAATVWVGLATCALAAFATAAAQPGQVEGMIVVDGLVTLVRWIVLAVTAGILLVAAGDPRVEDRGAFTVCTLGIALGSAVTAAAGNLLVLWLGLETVSLASYALAAWKGGDRAAAEAGMKFVLFGGLASALMLFGMSHVYGLTGHLDLAGIGEALPCMSGLALAALAFVGVGLAYKLTIVPFHFYAPDVYQGAPALSVAAVGIAPKVAAALVLARGVQMAVPGTLAAPAAVGNTLAVVAAVSLLVAAFTALVQRDAKRIIAFSGIGHAGTAVLALACLPGDGALRAALFQLLAYAIGSMGALACLHVLENDRGSSRLDDLRGASRERPWTTAMLCLFLFSLAGVPPLAGFLGKWAVLREALAFGLAEPARHTVAVAALLLLVTTALSAWAYLLVVRAVVLQPAGEPVPRARLPVGTALVLAVSALLAIGVGLWLDGIAAIGAGS
jgi:NADH-quinone oxidoreductase subunit N